VSAARQDLLDKTIAYVAAHGLSDLSLRELAAGIGTSHRMLIYHFGNREGLLAAIVATIEAQQRTALELLAVDASSPREVITAQWAQLSDPALAPYVMLFFEVLALALQRRPRAARAPCAAALRWSPRSRRADLHGFRSGR